MGSYRRLIAAATALSIAWTALWPLVSAAHSMAADEAVPLCHQAGMQVAPDMAPMQAPGAPKQSKQHCPLCVMAFLAAFLLSTFAAVACQVTIVELRRRGRTVPQAGELVGYLTGRLRGRKPATR